MVEKSPNPFVNNYFFKPRQKLIEDLIIQAIRMNGMFIRYIPREQFERDPLFGDDTFAKFNYAFEIEVYVKSYDNYEGQNEIMTMFGEEQRDQITFTVSRRRWRESNEEKVLDEYGNPIEPAESPDWTPYETVTLTEENGPGGDYSVEASFPKAGDLIYMPMVDKIFEILFVEHENLFHPLGTLLTYDLKCELFRYNNEEFDTGDDAIDAFNTLLSTDQLPKALDDEDGDPIEDQSGNDVLVEENNVIEDKDSQADNELLQKNGEVLIDYSDQSPFINRGKW
jgi:hypothetical protein